LAHFVANWYIFARFGTLHEERSGNPARGTLKNLLCSTKTLLEATIVRNNFDTGNYRAGEKVITVP
jgi:hypothetical protein